MKGWDAWLKDLINLITWLAFAFGLWWKAFDYLEKRARERSLGAEKIKDYDKKIEEFEKCTRELKEENIAIKANVEQLMKRMWDYLSK